MLKRKNTILIKGKACTTLSYNPPPPRNLQLSITHRTGVSVFHDPSLDSCCPSQVGQLGSIYYKTLIRPKAQSIIIIVIRQH